MYIFPSASSATADIKLNVADVAGPPSPPNALVPVPATVVMIPVLAETLRTTLLSESAMK